MIKHSIKKFALPLALAMFLGFTGCSSGGGSSTTTDSTDGDGSTPDAPVEETYTGSMNLSGSFETFASANQSIARSIVREAGSEIVKLYVLDENGDMKDTGIECTVDGSAYSCPGIAGEKEYIVRYIKDLGNGSVLEMKSNVAIEDADVTDAEVSRVTSLIVEAITKAIEEAVVGVEIDEATVKNLIASVKDAIVNAISSLVQDGLISLPTEADMTITLSDGEDFDSFVGTTQENENLADSSGVIITDESVSNTVGSGKNDAKLDSYADMTNTELVKTIFAQTGDGDDDMPDWVIDFLAAKYDTTNGYTMGSFLAKLEFESRDGDSDYLTKELVGIGIDENDQEGLIASIIADLETSVNDGGALASLKATIAEHYAIKAKAVKTDDDYKKLGEFPPIIEFLFSEADAAAMTSTTPIANMGQAIILIVFVEEVVTTEIISAKITALVGAENVFEEQLRNIRIVESDPFFMFEDLGFQDELATYDNLSIGHFEARTDKFWNDTGADVEFLSVYTGVEKPSWMFGEDGADASKFTSATLTYPTATGTKSVDLVVDADGDWVELKYSPWSNCDGSTECTQDETKMDITDNVSGDYVVSVTYDGETVSKTFETFVLKGAFDMRAKLISPTEMPQWPEELNGDNVNWDSQEVQDLQNDFSTAMHSYQVTTFAVNNAAGDAVENVVFKWDDSELNKKLETLNLPENIIPAYQVNISLRSDDCGATGNWEDCNTEIYNTWWNNRAVQSTSFMLPIELRATTQNEKYNIGVNVVFLNKDTGREVGQGGHSWAEFTVGDAAVLTGDEQIIFNGSVTAEEGATIPANFKVALMAEECEFNSATFVHACTRVAIGTPVSTSGDYTISVDVSDIQTAMGDNKNIMLIAFDDQNNDGDFTDWDPSKTPEENSAAESAYWPNASHFWFENWGDFRVGISNCNETNNECTYETEQLVPGEDITVDDIDFKLYNYNSSLPLPSEDAETK